MIKATAWLRVLGAALTTGSTRAFFDRIAPVYDVAFDRHARHADVMLQILRDSLPSEKDGLVIDLGCGTGFLTRGLVSAGYRALGIDVSEQSLRVMHEFLPTASVVQADAGQLPLESECADAVLCLGAWRHLPSPDAAASEIARVLRPDGIAIVSYFPPAFGGVFHLKRTWLRSRLSWLYDRLMPLLGYSDKVGEGLETQAVSALKTHFETVRRVPSGANWTALVAKYPRSDRRQADTRTGWQEQPIL